MASDSEAENVPGRAIDIYAKIAKGLRNLRELGLAVDVCDAAIEKYPDNSNLYITKSQILIAGFKEKPDPEALKSALANLEKALKLDPESYIARILASQIYLKGGALKRAKRLLGGILAAMPDDEKATAMMAVIEKKERKKAPPKTDTAPASPAAPAEQTAPAETAPARPAPEQTVPAAEEEEEDDDVVIVSPKIGEVSESTADAAPATMEDTEPESEQWVLDEKIIIDVAEDEDNSHNLEALSTKLTLFGRLEGLKAIFLVDSNGQPIKIINKANIDENSMPSLIFNLYRASVSSIRKSGLGSFQRSALVTPIGTIIMANAFYATLALVVDNDANMKTVEARLQRYLDVVSG